MVSVSLKVKIDCIATGLICSREPADGRICFAMCWDHKLYKNNGHSHRDVTHYFVDSHFEFAF